MSITNFYYFGNNILYKKHNKTDAKGDNGKEDTADGSDIKAVADINMEVTSTCDELPIATGDALIALFPGEEDRLLMMANSMQQLYRARIEGEPLDVDVELCRGCYAITLPEYRMPSGERMAELVNLSADEQPPRIKECATAYRRLLDGSKEEVGEGNINGLMKRASKIIGFVKGFIMQSYITAKRRTAPRIKYSEKDFYRLIITSVSAATVMSGGEAPELLCRVGKRVASFRTIFHCALPDSMKEHLLSGKYDDCSFMGTHGEVCLMICYIRHICHVYGYFLTLEETDNGRISMCITLPLLKDGVAAMGIREHVDDKWIISLIHTMLP